MEGDGEDKGGEAALDAEELTGEEWADWVIPRVGEEAVCTRRAPVDIPGWEERPWVKLRPLTHEEELRRRAVGWQDEYEVDAETGEPVLLRQKCDEWALACYDYQHCVVEYCLPRCAADGSVEPVKGNGRDWNRSVEVFRHLPARLARWLHAAIEEVNRRRPQDLEVLDLAKKR
ncbi:MAG: hypothetical protein ACE5R4_16290 [Armatimonadota bacterium]